MPCDYSKYPPNWFTEIRPRILERAKDKCERCAVVNYSVISRETGYYYVWQEPPYDHPDGLSDYQTAVEFRYCYNKRRSPDDKKVIIIILTIAHLDHDLSHNEDCNLQALCQKCHNNYDIGHRKSTRINKKCKDNFKLILSYLNMGL